MTKANCLKVDWVRRNVDSDVRRRN